MFPLQNEWGNRMPARSKIIKKRKMQILNRYKAESPKWTNVLRALIVSERRTKFCSILFWVYVMFVYANRHLCLCAWVRTQTRTPLCRLYSCLCLCLCLCLHWCLWARMHANQYQNQSPKSWVLSPETWIIDCPNIVHCFYPPGLISCR